MSIADLTTYAARALAARRVYFTNIVPAGISVCRGGMFSAWRANVDIPAIPSTAVALTSTSAGAFAFHAAASGSRCYGAELCGLEGESGFALILCDRLCHQGGLVGNSAASQTTNLPTAALPRYTTGDGVMMAYEIYTTIGSTLRTITATYTNQAGTASRTSAATPIGGNSGEFQADNTFHIIGLQAGDTGVRSVESIQLSASTGTAGNFGITLFRPLAILPVPYDFNRNHTFDALLHLGANLPEIQPNACLFFAGVTDVGNPTACRAGLLFGQD